TRRRSGGNPIRDGVRRRDGRIVEGRTAGRRSKRYGGGRRCRGRTWGTNGRGGPETGTPSHGGSPKFRADAAAGLHSCVGNQPALDYGQACRGRLVRARRSASASEAEAWSRAADHRSARRI